MLGYDCHTDLWIHLKTLLNTSYIQDLREIVIIAEEYFIVINSGKEE